MPSGRKSRTDRSSRQVSVRGDDSAAQKLVTIYRKVAQLEGTFYEPGLYDGDHHIKFLVVAEMKTQKHGVIRSTYSSDREGAHDFLASVSGWMPLEDDAKLHTYHFAPGDRLTLAQSKHMTDITANAYSVPPNLVGEDDSAAIPETLSCGHEFGQELGHRLPVPLGVGSSSAEAVATMDQIVHGTDRRGVGKVASCLGESRFLGTGV